MGFFKLNTLTGLAIAGAAATAAWYFRKWSREEKMTAISKNEECPVCLDTLKLCNMTVLPCGHGFHYSCIDAWMDDYQRFTCPTCRQKIGIHLPWEDLQALSALGALWVVLDMGIII